MTGEGHGDPLGTGHALFLGLGTDYMDGFTL